MACNAHVSVWYVVLCASAQGQVHAGVQSCISSWRATLAGMMSIVWSFYTGHVAVRRCVGWYHSHPQFATHPSIIDIHNQVRCWAARMSSWPLNA